jgi:hypothetical protein
MRAELFRADGRTDMKKLIVVFRCFADIILEPLKWMKLNWNILNQEKDALDGAN